MLGRFVALTRLMQQKEGAGKQCYHGASCGFRRPGPRSSMHWQHVVFLSEEEGAARIIELYLKPSAQHTDPPDDVDDEDTSLELLELLELL